MTQNSKLITGFFIVGLKKIANIVSQQLANAMLRERGEAIR
jgi:hypothetical protein